MEAEARTDAAGNLYLTRRGSDPALPALVMGSHLDSVAHGGNFDGAAGVAAGLGVMAELAAGRIVLPRDLTILVTRAEEAAWFPLSYPGALAALGRLPAAALGARRADTHRTLADHMAAAGFDPEAVRREAATLTPANCAGFIEVHIEQGPRLVRLDRPIALVSAINGGFRYVDARCLGTYAHSGAEPRFSRQDSVLGFCDLVAGLEILWDALEAAGTEVTITIGRLQSDPTQHGGSRVLGEVGFTLDIRAADVDTLDGIRSQIGRLCRAISTRRGVTFDLGSPMTWAPARMDGGLIVGLERSGDFLGLDLPLMNSGAGHDAAAFAEAGVPTAMIFVRNHNGSHNPDEAMDCTDLDEALRLLLYFVIHFDDPKRGGT